MTVAQISPLIDDIVVVLPPAEQACYVRLVMDVTKVLQDHLQPERVKLKNHWLQVMLRGGSGAELLPQDQQRTFKGTGFAVACEGMGVMGHPVGRWTASASL